MFRKHFLTGLAVLFPIVITIYILYLLFGFVDDVAGRFINDFVEAQFGFSIPGLGVLLTFVFIFLAGLGYNIFFGKRIYPVFDKLFRKIPLVSNIYPSAKQLSDFLFQSEQKQKKKFEKVVIIEFPQKDTYSVGFITNDHVEELESEEDGEHLISVFVPLAPAPFSGHILLVPRKRIREVNMSIDRAVKFVVSGGVVLSEQET